LVILGSTAANVKKYFEEKKIDIFIFSNFFFLLGFSTWNMFGISQDNACNMLKTPKNILKNLHVVDCLALLFLIVCDAKK